MTTRIQKWGNSQGLRLPPEVLVAANMAVGDEVDVAVLDGQIIIRPLRKVRGRYNLEALLSGVPIMGDENDVDWESSHGKEVW